MSEYRKLTPPQDITDKRGSSSLPHGVDSGRMPPAEISHFLGTHDNFQLIGSGGSLLDICLPVDPEGGIIPTSIKVINTYDSQFERTGSRVRKWAQPAEIERAQDLLYVPEGLPIQPEIREKFGLLALEHQMHERLYSPYVLPAVFVAFVPRADVIEKKARKINKDEMDNRLRTEAITQDGRRIILKKGTPAIAMVEDYFEQTTGIDGAEPLSPLLREQLQGLIARIESGYYQNGFYPDPAITNPYRKKLIVINGERLLLTEAVFLLSKQNDFAKKDFDKMLDALYYYAREH